MTLKDKITEVMYTEMGRRGWPDNITYDDILIGVLKCWPLLQEKNLIPPHYTYEDYKRLALAFFNWNRD